MSWKWFALGALCLATITACATPAERVVSERAAARQQALLSTVTIAGGGYDGVGQFIRNSRPGDGGITLEASAAPKSRDFEP